MFRHARIVGDLVQHVNGCLILPTVFQISRSLADALIDALAQVSRVLRAAAVVPQGQVDGNGVLQLPVLLQRGSRFIGGFVLLFHGCRSTGGGVAVLTQPGKGIGSLQILAFVFQTLREGVHIGIDLLAGLQGALVAVAIAFQAFKGSDGLLILARLVQRIRPAIDILLKEQQPARLVDHLIAQLPVPHDTLVPAEGGHPGILRLDDRLSLGVDKAPVTAKLHPRIPLGEVLYLLVLRLNSHQAVALADKAVQAILALHLGIAILEASNADPPVVIQRRTVQLHQLICLIAPFHQHGILAAVSADQADVLSVFNHRLETVVQQAAFSGPCPRNHHAICEGRSGQGIICACPRVAQFAPPGKSAAVRSKQFQIGTTGILVHASVVALFPLGQGAISRLRDQASFPVHQPITGLANAVIGDDGQPGRIAEGANGGIHRPDVTVIDQVNVTPASLQLESHHPGVQSAAVPRQVANAQQPGLFCRILVVTQLPVEFHGLLIATAVHVHHCGAVQGLLADGIGTLRGIRIIAQVQVTVVRIHQVVLLLGCHRRAIALIPDCFIQRHHAFRAVRIRAQLRKGIPGILQPARLFHFIGIGIGLGVHALLNGRNPGVAVGISFQRLKGLHGPRIPSGRFQRACVLIIPLQNLSGDFRHAGADVAKLQDGRIYLPRLLIILPGLIGAAGVIHRHHVAVHKAAQRRQGRHRCVILPLLRRGKRLAVHGVPGRVVVVPQGGKARARLVILARLEQGNGRLISLFRLSRVRLLQRTTAQRQQQKKHCHPGTQPFHPHVVPPTPSVSIVCQDQPAIHTVLYRTCFFLPSPEISAVFQPFGVVPAFPGVTK